MSDLSSVEIKKIVTNYVKVVQKNNPCNEIRDVSRLPFPKDVIINACLQFMAGNENPNIRDTVGTCLSLISFYQEGVGPQPLRDCRFDLFPFDVNSLSEADFAKLKEAVVINLPHLDADRYLKLLGLVQTDFKKIEAACEAIIRT